MSDSWQFKLLMNDQQGADINHPQLRLPLLGRRAVNVKVWVTKLRCNCILIIGEMFNKFHIRMISVIKYYIKVD